MSNPLFYNKIVPLDKGAHRDIRLDLGKDRFAFARTANMVPALIDEFGAALAHLPIAFLPGSRQPAAVFVTGLKPGSNLFVDAKGAWDAQYVPAYLRRYPFIMGDVPEGEPILCVDEAFPGLNPKTGDRLFSEGGDLQPVVQQALDLAVNYKNAATRTDDFCATLQQMDLLSAVTLDAKADDGESTVVHGLFVVDEKAFDSLSAQALGTLHEKRYLKPIVQHLASLGAIVRLGERARTAKPAAARTAKSI
ncbi:SapC family protein [Pelagibacterium montanilacus]|uniref:SapC family protein n=1 Tax=Pelagibacterium montanilacus TaxID=2185280 RepID=UPI000F8EEDBA|nr:SapC family protein [Pelagibacterium montanilacus]